MRAKELLDEISKQNIIIEHKLEELERLKVMCEMSGISFEGEKVQGSSAERNMMVEYIEMKDEVMAYIKESYKLKKQLMNIVDKIANKKCVEVIYKRYFENMKMYDIANELNYSHQRVYQLHKEALREIDGRLEEIC